MAYFKKLGPSNQGTKLILFIEPTISAKNLHIFPPISFKFVSGHHLPICRKCDDSFLLFLKPLTYLTIGPPLSPWQALKSL